MCATGEGYDVGHVVVGLEACESSDSDAMRIEC
jgi:hypothetical protein